LRFERRWQSNSGRFAESGSSAAQNACSTNVTFALVPVSQSCSLKPIDGEVPEDERATSVMPSVAEQYSSAVPFWAASARNTISLRAELRGRRSCA